MTLGMFASNSSQLPTLPKPTNQPLPSVRGIPNSALELQDTPRGKREGHLLMRAIDYDLRTRYDHDDRMKLFAKDAEPRIWPGSLVMVEQLTSKTRGTKTVFAGILVAIRRRGLQSNIVLRNYVLGTAVEMMFPLFSPTILNVKILKSRKMDNISGDSAYWIRDNPQKLSISYANLDEMARRHISFSRNRPMYGISMESDAKSSSKSDKGKKK